MLRDLTVSASASECAQQELSQVTIVSDHAKTHEPPSRSTSTISSQSTSSQSTTSSSSKARLDRWQPAPLPPPPTDLPAKSRWESMPHSPNLGSFRKSTSGSAPKESPSSEGPQLPQRTSSHRESRPPLPKTPTALAASSPQLPKRCPSNDTGDFSSSRSNTTGRPAFRKGLRPSSKDRTNPPAA